MQAPSDPFQPFGPAYEIETPAPLGLAGMRAYTTRPEENSSAIGSAGLPSGYKPAMQLAQLISDRRAHVVHRVNRNGEIEASGA
jgi:hypothetical protein